MPNETNLIHIIDTTLRDGEQRAKIAFSIKEKIECAKLMDRYKFFQIEAGIPAMGINEKKAIYDIMKNKKNSIISTWNRMNINDINASIECNPDIIHISVPSSDIQIFHKLKENRAFVENQMKACIYTAASKGYTVTLGLEDASRADDDFLLELIKIAESYKVTRIRYADTVGISFPSKISNIIKKIKNHTLINIEMHAHNDLGMAVANSITAARCGAVYINTTMFGIGERAGNCNFKTFTLLANKIFDLGLNCSDKDVTEMERSISGIIGIIE